MATEDEGGGKKKKSSFRPFKSLRRLFQRGSAKSTDEPEAETTPSFRSKSTSNILDQRDGRNQSSDDDVTDPGHANPSLSALSYSVDSVFNPEAPMTSSRPSRASPPLSVFKPKHAQSIEGIYAQKAFTNELFRKIKGRKDEDEGLSVSPVSHVSTSDVIQYPIGVSDRSRSRSRESDIYSMDSMDEVEEDFFAKSWASGLNHSSQRRLVRDGRSGPVNLDDVSQPATALNLTAEKSRIALRKRSARPRTRQSGRATSPGSPLGRLAEERRTTEHTQHTEHASLVLAEADVSIDEVHEEAEEEDDGPGEEAKMAAPTVTTAEVNMTSQQVAEATDSPLMSTSKPEVTPEPEVAASSRAEVTSLAGSIRSEVSSMMDTSAQPSQDGGGGVVVLRKRPEDAVGRIKRQTIHVSSTGSIQSLNDLRSGATTEETAKRRSVFETPKMAADSAEPEFTKVIGKLRKTPSTKRSGVASQTDSIHSDASSSGADLGSVAAKVKDDETGSQRSLLKSSEDAIINNTSTKLPAEKDTKIEPPNSLSLNSSRQGTNNTSNSSKTGATTSTVKPIISPNKPKLKSPFLDADSSNKQAEKVVVGNSSPLTERRSQTPVSRTSSSGSGRSNSLIRDDELPSISASSAVKKNTPDDTPSNQRDSSVANSDGNNISAFVKLRSTGGTSRYGAPKTKDVAKDESPSLLRKAAVAKEVTKEVEPIKELKEEPPKPKEPVAVVNAPKPKQEMSISKFPGQRVTFPSKPVAMATASENTSAAEKEATSTSAVKPSEKEDKPAVAKAAPASVAKATTASSVSTAASSAPEAEVSWIKLAQRKTNKFKVAQDDSDDTKDVAKDVAKDVVKESDKKEEKKEETPKTEKVIIIEKRSETPPIATTTEKVAEPSDPPKSLLRPGAGSSGATGSANRKSKVLDMVKNFQNVQA